MRLQEAVKRARKLDQITNKHTYSLFEKNDLDQRSTIFLQNPS